MIDYFGFGNKLISVKTKYALKARRKMFTFFMNELAPQPDDEVLDLGATPESTLADSNLFDKLYPWKNRITVASIEDCGELVNDLGLKRFVFNYPKSALPFGDKEFDLLICSAVLEHVGNHEDQDFFIGECLRVSKKVFITTPYRYFPVEMHTFIPFLHWLPWKVFQKYVRKTKGDFFASDDNLMLCSKSDILKMKSIETQKLQGTVKIHFVHTLLWPSNMLIICK